MIIYAISLAELKKLQRFPRFPDDSHSMVNARTVEGNALNVFISHCWLQGMTIHGKVYPDTPSNEKYKLCIEGLEKLVGEDCGCYVWMDYMSLNQDRNPVHEMTKYDFDRVMEWSDCMFTPLPDPSIGWVLNTTSEGLYSDYKAKSFSGDERAYLSRSWCRLEMVYAATTPLSSFDVSKYHTAHNFIPDAFIKDKRRPHFLYGSRESMLQVDPICLPAIDNINLFLLRFDPLQGHLTVSSDRAVLEGLMEHITAAHKTNAVQHTFDNGDTYEGGWANETMNGWGVLRTAAGEVLEGAWRNGLLHGEGKYLYATGDVYLGHFKDTQRHGKGKFHRTSKGDVYEGEFKNDKPHGCGIFKTADGKSYESGIPGKPKSFCRIVWPNGDSYEGSTSDGKMHGLGRFNFSDGRILIGYFDHGDYTGTEAPSRWPGCTTS